MLWIAITAGVLWLGIAMVVVADMFRKNAALGFLGIFLLPLVPFIWVIKWYSGKRLLVGSALYLSAAVSWIALSLAWDVAAEDLEPFIRLTKLEASLDCHMTATGSGGGHTYYQLLCTSNKIKEIRFSSSEDMIKQYSDQLVAPLTAIYGRTMTGANPPHLVVGIVSPVGLVTCHRLSASGVLKAWVTGTEEPCK